MIRAIARCRPLGWMALALALAGWPAVRVSAQTLSITTAGDILRVKAAELTIIEGPVLERLKDGRPVRIALDLAVLRAPKGAALAHDVRTFNLSLDLWEERFAVSLEGTPARSISHLQARDADVWCVGRLAVPASALGSRRDAPFWIRLEYRLLDSAPVAEGNAEEGLTLGGLIDRLSRRPRRAAPGRAIEAGPFRWAGGS